MGYSKGWDRQSAILLIFLDLLISSLLPEHMEAMGIGGTVLQCLQFFLVGQSQKVTLRDHCFTPTSWLQGSILFAMLLTSILNCLMRSFWDLVDVRSVCQYYTLLASTTYLVESCQGTERGPLATTHWSIAAVPRVAHYLSSYSCLFLFVCSHSLLKISLGSLIPLPSAQEIRLARGAP